MKATGSIRLDAEGRWWHDGEEITHERTIALFNRSIIIKKGAFFLTGESAPVPIQVDDVPYFVRAVSKDSQGREMVSLSDGTEELLDWTSLDVGKADRLYCRVKNAAGRAVFERKVYNQFTKNLSERNGFYGVERGGLFYPLGRKMPLVTNVAPEVVTPVSPSTPVSQAKPVVAPVKSATPIKKSAPARTVKSKPTQSKKIAKKPAVKKAAGAAKKSVKPKTVKKKTAPTKKKSSRKK